MTDTATPAPPRIPTYTISAVKSLGNGLWQLTVILPNRSTVHAVLTFDNATLQTVILSAEVVGFLATTKNGAEPLLRQFK